jgi:uncharacterized protein (TIGR03382 family)
VEHAPAAFRDAGVSLNRTLMFAQSLGEYGALASVVSGVRQLLYPVRAWLKTQDATIWMIVGAVVFLWLVVRRRR